MGPALAKLAALLVLVVGANVIVGALTDALNIEIRPSNEDLVHRLIMVAAAAYAVLIAIPFVPGIEIGLAIIGVLGTKIVPLVYLCTLVGLVASYAIGRLASLETLAVIFDFFDLKRAATLLRTIEPLNRASRMEFLVRNAPARYVPTLLRYRHLALGIALNLPGNFLLGGGGGIGIVAGVSGLYSPVGFVLTVAIAVSPVPIAIHLFGLGILPH